MLPSSGDEGLSDMLRQRAAILAATSLSTTGAYVDILVFGSDEPDLETVRMETWKRREAGVDCVFAGPSAKSATINMTDVLLIISDKFWKD